MQRIARVGLLAALSLAWAAGVCAADLKRGEQLFQTCAACHLITGDGLGPDLHGVFGRKSGRVAGYEYSPAMLKANLTWDLKTLSAFVTNPQAVVPETKMTFPGYTSPADVQNVVAWLKQLR